MQTKIQEPAIVQNEASVLKDDEKKITTLPYSCYFEVQLDEKDFGKRRAEHFRICNEQLVIQLVELEKDGMQLCSEVSNAFLIDTIRKCKTQPPGKDLFTWEHCSSLTANGRLGVMRLVPASQHKKTSEHWKSLHPDKHNRGGYHEWAIPAGAPANKKSPIPNDVNIKKITLEQLPQYFEIAVSANRFDQFSEVLIRAKEICAPRKRGIMLTQCYPMGKSKKLNTLLHVAVKNGYKPMIEKILGCGAKIEDILLIQNHTGNTIAHIAAENNRHNILRDLKALGADLTIRNKRKETVADIVHTRKYTACIPVLLASTNPDNSHNEEGGKKCVTPPDRDPHFAYGTNSKNGAAHQKSGAQSTFHAPVKNSTRLNRAASVSNKSYVETLKDIIKKRTDSTKATNSNNHNQAPKNTFQKIVRNNQQNGTIILPGKTQTNALSTIFKYKEAFIETLSKQSRQLLKLNQQKLHETQSRTQQDARKQAKQQNQQRVHKQVQQTTQQTAHKQSQQQTQQQNQQRAQQQAQRPQQQNQQRAQQQNQQRAQQQNQQRAQQQNQQRTQQQNQQRAQQQNQQRAQQQNQQRAQQQNQQRAQQQNQQRAQQQNQQRAQQQNQQRAQQQNQQRAQQQNQQRAQQQNQQRAQQQNQQRAQQQNQQRAQQQNQQRAQQQNQQRAQQQAHQRAQEQARTRAHQQAQQRAQQLSRAQAAQHARNQANQRAQYLAQAQARQRAYQRK